MVTYTVKPIANGTGYMQVSDKNDSSIYCKIPIYVKMAKDGIDNSETPNNPTNPQQPSKTVTIGTSLPFSTVDSVEESIFKIEACEASVSVGSTADTVSIVIKGTYLYSPGRFNHYMHAVLYDADGYIINSHLVGINKGYTGDKVSKQRILL